MTHPLAGGRPGCHADAVWSTDEGVRRGSIPNAGGRVRRQAGSCPDRSGALRADVSAIVAERRALVIAILLLWAAAHPADCATPAGCPPAEFAAARGIAEAACPCALASDHQTYVRCVGGALAAAANSQRVSPRCRRDTLRALKRSTCGRGGAVACCTTRGGSTRCRIRTSAAACAGRGASCVSPALVCADACTASGCVTTTTTTTTGPATTATTVTVTTSTSGVSTTTAPYCGYGLAAPACDGPCPSGSSCQPGLPGSGYCGCVVDARPCGAIDGAPLCHGSCPDATPICADVGGTCTCVGAPITYAFEDCPTTTTTVPPQPCGVNDYNQICGGMCAAPASCEVGGDGQCGCTGTRQSCGGYTDYPATCGGPCPSGETCRTVAILKFSNPFCGTHTYCGCFPE